MESSNLRCCQVRSSRIAIYSPRLDERRVFHRSLLKPVGADQALDAEIEVEPFAGPRRHAGEVVDVEAELAVLVDDGSVTGGR